LVFFGHVEKGHCFIAVEKKNRALGNTTLVTKPSIHRIIVYSRYLATINVLLKLPLWYLQSILLLIDSLSGGGGIFCARLRFSILLKTCKKK